MNAVNGGSLQNNNDGIKIPVFLHTFSDRTSKLICTWLVVAK